MEVAELAIGKDELHFVSVQYMEGLSAKYGNISTRPYSSLFHLLMQTNSAQ